MIINLCLYSQEIPGGGLICQMTGDPLEADVKKGILVAVTVQSAYRLPTLHQRVGMFHQWVVDLARGISPSWTVLDIALIVHIMAR